MDLMMGMMNFDMMMKPIMAMMNGMMTNGGLGGTGNNNGGLGDGSGNDNTCSIRLYRIFVKLTCLKMFASWRF